MDEYSRKKEKKRKEYINYNSVTRKKRKSLNIQDQDLESIKEGFKM